VQPWKVLSRKTLLVRPWLEITEERVQLPNGTVIGEFHVLHSPPWAALIAITPDRQMVLVEQYRHGLGRTSLELPSGVIDQGELPLQAAKRELREETGYQSHEWESLVVLAPEPSRSTHRAHFFVCTGSQLSGCAQPEASEVINVSLVPIDSVLEYIDQGRIDHAAHVGAILLAARRGLLRAGSG
jgi:8-oxo-dGTP pyrophosphatase MutT (NUDIX family)